MRFERGVGIVTFAVVIAAVVLGFATIGTPQHMRTVELDRQRVDDLGSIAQDLHNNGQGNAKQRLPDRLSGVDDPKQRRRDPQTGVPYEYRRETARRYRLCAVFALPSDPERTDPHWKHGAGRACFRFDADRDVVPLADPAPASRR